MADNLTLNSGSGGATVRSLEDAGGVQWPAGVTVFATTVGTPDVLQVVTPAFGLPVRLADGSGYIATLPVSIAATVTVTGAGGSFPVTDSGGSLTVDAPVGTPVFVRLSDGSSAITTLPVSVASVPSHDVTNAGTFAVQAAQSGTWTVQPGNTANTTAWLVTGTGGTFPVTDSGGSLTVDAPVGTPVFVRLSDGSAAISTLPVSLASVPSHAVTNAGTFAVQVDGTALTRLTDIETNTDSLAVVGNGAAAAAQRVTLANDSTGVLATVSTVTTLTGGGVAHDAADSGNPHKIGAKATASLSAATLVAGGDRTDLFGGLDGVLITRPHCNLEDVVSGNATNTDGTSTQCIAAQASGIKTYLTTIVLANSHATTNCTVDIKDGTTVKLSIPVPANGGAVVNLPVPLPGTAATAWNFDPSAAVTTITCSMVGFKSKV